MRVSVCVCASFGAAAPWFAHAYRLITKSDRSVIPGMPMLTVRDDSLPSSA